MSHKHIFNSSEGLVLKSLRGAVALNPELRLHAQSQSIYTTHNNGGVLLVSGGGAGHEPAHASYTGQGMLSASVSGDIFASPSAKQIVCAVELALGSQQTSSPDHPESIDESGKREVKGEVLLIINNYTGDRLNFGLAITRLKALYPRLDIESVVVADDVSLLKSTSSLVGPRGLAGNILVCKVLGAFKESFFGQSRPSLKEAKTLGDAVVKSLRSVGVGLEHCHVPGRNREDEDETTQGGYSDGEGRGCDCEVGMGLHNEPGARKGRFENEQALLAEMLELVLTSPDPLSGDGEGMFVSIGRSIEEMDEVILFVNNLGGMSQLEMGALVHEAVEQLNALHIHPRRIYSSSYMTSLNAPGFSFSLLNLSLIRRILSDNQSLVNVDILSLLDAPTTAHSWLGTRSWPIKARSSRRSYEEEEAEADAALRSLHRAQAGRRGNPRMKPNTMAERQGKYWCDADISVTMVESAIRGACQKVIEYEAEMTRFDTIVGDGDCGETFKRGATAVLRALDTNELDVKSLDPPALMRRLGEILEDNMGGTIGALLAIFFTSLASSLPNTPNDSKQWRTAPSQALEALSTYTPARPGDRTLVDALKPFCIHLEGNSTGSVSGMMDGAAKSAKEGAESTRGMKAKLGRASYIGSDGEKQDSGENGLPPDPGAWGVAAIIEGMLQGIKNGGTA